MKCKICGAESGKYPLCRACNDKKEKGIIIKCPSCNDWHFANKPCHTTLHSNEQNDEYVYSLKRSLITKSELGYFVAILDAIPEDYHVFPQINLASFIEKNTNTRFHNELFRNVDFLITDSFYAPKLVIEINDMSHMNNDRRERDEKVQKICEEAGIPFLKLWTSYGINPEYIKSRIYALLEAPMVRVHHFNSQNNDEHDEVVPKSSQRYTNNHSKKQSGCYVATCVYGSYDCPEVWVLRRYRDNILAKEWYGRLFIRIYYAISPSIVKIFGKQKWFHSFCKKKLDRMTKKLCNRGFSYKPYYDK